MTTIYSNGNFHNNSNGMNNNNEAASSASIRDSISVDYSHQPDPTHGTSTITVATFNLVATIVGGGVLSLPFAFQKCGGALWGICWMLVGAICTDLSCVWMCWCARPGGTNIASTSSFTTNTPTIDQEHILMLSSYGQVCRAAFGPILEVAVSALLFVFLVFVIIAYMVLVKDIWTPLVLSLFGSISSNNNSPSAFTQKEQDAYWAPYVLMGIVLIMSPFLVQKTLHALRFNCYIGFASVSTLCLALCHYALEPPAAINVLWTRDFWTRPPESIRDVLTAFPIYMLSYICHFNVNPVQKALIDPSAKRVNTVIHGAMLACGTLMTIFGVAGYAYVVGNNTYNTSTIVQGNILLNCEEQIAANTSGRTDVLLWLGRVGCGITIMLAMPMMLLPCRGSLLEVLDIVLLHHYNSTGGDNNNNDKKPTIDEVSPLLGMDDTTLLQPPASLSDNAFVHYTATFLIIVVCYITAIMVPGVAIVWSLCGSSMAFTIAFILPAACFLQMAHRREQVRVLLQAATPSCVSKTVAWVIMIISTLGAVVCTTQTIQSMY